MKNSHPLRVRPKQSLGQNFLVDDNIARNIVRDLRLSVDDVVVEIGAGRGALTAHLAGKVRRLIAVEIDGRIVEELRATYASEKVDVVHGDILAVSFPELARRLGSPIRLVGNIPYHLTSPIMFKVFDERAAVHDLTVMVQREVALRITAKPRTKAYGILSVLTQFYGTPELLFTVSPNCFYPIPKVTSAVIRIAIRHQEPADVDGATFKRVVKTAFGKRRKTLRNSLADLPLGGYRLDMVLAGAGVSGRSRAEELTVEQFTALARHVMGTITA